MSSPSNELQPNSNPSEGILLPDGSPSSQETPSSREKIRQSEDAEYVPVIIKRNDVIRRHPDDALNHAIEEGLEQLERPLVSLLLSAIAAGLIVGFSAMAVAVVLTGAQQMELNETASRLLTAFFYPLGFVVCVLSGAQLFTEHTATALYPVLDGKATWTRLVRLWLVVIVGNLIGAFCCAALHFSASEVTQAQEGYIQLGHHLTHFDNQSLFVSAVLAGWLMALGAWLIGASSRTLAQIAVVYIATFLIGVGGFHHSIAGSVEMFTAIFLSEEFNFLHATNFIATALLGNLVGGSFFVALLNYGHIRRTND